MSLKLRILLTKGTKGSASMRRVADALSAQLGYKVWRSTLEKPGRTHLKYGMSTDKIAQYKYFKEHSINALEFTQSQQEAAQWLKDKCTVVGRKLTSSQCGHGIVLYEPGETIGSCPVYTKYKKKKREFRVNVFKGQVIRTTEKKLKNGWDKGPAKIRNLENGYVFCNVDISSLPAGLDELAAKAAKVVGSDFAGVDIGYNEHNNELFVIEVNSAPGIEGSTVDAYVSAILKVA